MKYIQRTTQNFKDNFLTNLLLDRNILKEDKEYNEKFFNPTKENLLKPDNLDNIKDGFELLINHLKNNSKLYIIQDPDCDGLTSAAIMYNYLKSNFIREKFGETDIEYHIPDGKSHGLESVFEDLKEYKQYDLIILPDSSSNDYEFHEELKNIGYDILVLDHHLASKYSENATVINNQLSDNYSNKDLSGAGVVLKFIQYCDEQFNSNEAEKYYDLAALGICGDMMDLNGLENRYICSKGFSHIQNIGFQMLVKQQSYSIFGKTFPEEYSPDFFNNLKLTPIQVAFYIVPLINALIRVGNHTEKEILFKAFISGEEVINSTKRGHSGEVEMIAEQSARNCYNSKAKQNREKDKAVELLDIQIANDCLDENKILVLNADELDVQNTLTGLIAMGISAKYKKPTILGRVNKDGYMKGSIRGVGDSELKDFRQLLLDSGLMDYVEG